jgi:molybdopterin-guanine dinucleotide biosynthesis protein A
VSTLAVLAGGEGSRMGAPKDLLRAGGRPVLRALLERLRWEGDTVLVAPHGGRLPPGHEEFDKVVCDATPGQGPLRGILTALSAGIGNKDIVVIPVDMPGVEREHLEWIGRQLSGRRSALGVMLKRGERIEPFPSGFRIGAGAMIQRRLEAGALAVQQLAVEEDVEVVSPPLDWGDDVWRNVNAPEDLPPGWARP